MQQWLKNNAFSIASLVAVILIYSMLKIEIAEVRSETSQKIYVQKQEMLKVIHNSSSIDFTEDDRGDNYGCVYMGLDKLDCGIHTVSLSDAVEMIMDHNGISFEYVPDKKGYIKIVGDKTK